MEKIVDQINVLIDRFFLLMDFVVIVLILKGLKMMGDNVDQINVMIDKSLS